jgi:RimJ/RimL family protein N-acetyltransferase
MNKTSRYWSVGNRIGAGASSGDITFSGGINTVRLRLRRLCESDAPTITGLVSNWEVAKQTRTLPSPYTLDHALEFVRSGEVDWKKGSQYILGIERKSDCVLIGTVSVTIRKTWRRKIGEIGYWCGQEYWGEGYTSEAVAAFLIFCQSNLKLDVVQAKAFAENTASLNLLEAQGFCKTAKKTEIIPERGGKRKIIHLRLRSR